MSCGAGEQCPTAIGKTTEWAINAAFEKATLSPVPHQRFVSKVSSICLPIQLNDTPRNSIIIVEPENPIKEIKIIIKAQQMDTVIENNFFLFTAM